MNKFDKQIIFCDYDGTIYIREQDMERNLKLIDEYCKSGGIFVITTGRSKTSVDGVIAKYSIPYDYIISNNGAIIFDSFGNKMYEQTINNIDVLKIIQYLNSKENIQALYYDENDKVEYHNQELLKIRVITTKEFANQIEKEINTLFGDVVIAYVSFSDMYDNGVNLLFVDIVSVKAGKEKSIKKLLDLLNIEKGQAITIGDGRNDIAMIKEYNGYSMETAEDEAKQVASKIFKNVADIIEYLKKD